MLERIADKYLHYKLQESNFKDYADMNIRYLVSTGIVKRAGRGISLTPEYHTSAIELIKNVVSEEPLKTRYQKLCNGAELPRIILIWRKGH